MFWLICCMRKLQFSALLFMTTTVSVWCCATVQAGNCTLTWMVYELCSWQRIRMELWNDVVNRMSSYALYRARRGCSLCRCSDSGIGRASSGPLDLNIRVI